MKPSDKNLLPAPLAAVAALLLVACQPEVEPEAEELVTERSAARWEALIERDFDRAWDYYSPGFRDTTPRADFAADMRRRPIRWHGVEVHEAACDGDRCDVSLDVVYQAVAAPHGHSQQRQTRRLEETWIRLRDQWWYAPN